MICKYTTTLRANAVTEGFRKRSHGAILHRTQLLIHSFITICRVQYVELETLSRLSG